MEKTEGMLIRKIMNKPITEATDKTKLLAENDINNLTFLLPFASDMFARSLASSRLNGPTA